MEVRAGALIAGRYRLDRLLGEGGMGQVWAATHTVTRKTSALKFLHAPVSNRADLRKRFMREAQAAAAVNHPNVIAVHDFFELEDGTPAMVMDLLAGESLHERLSRVGSLSVAETARILAPVVSAVGAAHAAGVVHRDLKPDNIFLARGAGGDEVKVLDFGIAKLRDPGQDAPGEAVTGTGAIMGTPYYMAIEQASGDKDVDHRADVWALGVILFECLSGQRPIAGDNFGQLFKNLHEGKVRALRDFARDVPEDLVDLITRMLSIPRDRRPADLRDVLPVLLAHTSVTVRPVEAPIMRRSGSETPLEADAAPAASGADMPRAKPIAEATTELPVPRDATPPELAAPARRDRPAGNTGAHVVPAETPPAPTQRPRGRVAIGVALVGALGLGGILVVGRTDRAPAARAASTSVAGEVASPRATGDAPAATLDAPALPHVEPLATASAVPSGGVAAAPSIAASADKPAAAKTAKRDAPKPPPAASSVTAAPKAPPAPTASAPPKTPKGGLVEDAPF